MPNIRQLGPSHAVCGIIPLQDFGALKAEGVAHILDLLPEDETSRREPVEATRAAAEAAGIGYTYVPVAKHSPFDQAAIAKLSELLASTGGTVLTACLSGQRSAIVWAAIQARTTPVDEVLRDLRTAGFALDVIRSDLEAEAARNRDAAETSKKQARKHSEQSAAA